MLTWYALKMKKVVEPGATVYTNASEILNIHSTTNYVNYSVNDPT